MFYFLNRSLELRFQNFRAYSLATGFLLRYNICLLFRYFGAVIRSMVTARFNSIVRNLYVISDNYLVMLVPAQC